MIYIDKQNFLKLSQYYLVQIYATKYFSRRQQTLLKLLLQGDKKLSEFFEIAYAAASNRLCFFTGTGFSKAITANNAPSWQDLLEKLCELLPNSKNIIDALFPEDEANPLSLEEAAQVISIELKRVDKNIYEEVANIIEQLKLEGDNSEVADFLSKRSYRIITTNYDKLAEELAGKDDCHSISPGLPIPRSLERVKIYHVHGSTDSPANMVITSDDYFNFINSESYFSRKLSTVLHENTVVILGYSLSDTNLKAIISDYKGFSKNHVIGSNIFLVSRSSVSQYVKDYYSHCYGIRVIDNLEVEDFFHQLNTSIPSAEKQLKQSICNIKKVINKNAKYADSYLKVENSFFEIISSIAAIGLSINNQRVVEALGIIIDTKTRLTHENNAWEQYEQLARWLIYLGSILELEGTSIEEIYLNSVLRSMNTMRKELYIGYSWHAYKSWKSKWANIIVSNRVLIKKHIEKNTTWSDALAVVNSL